MSQTLDSILKLVDETYSDDPKRAEVTKGVIRAKFMIDTPLKEGETFDKKFRDVIFTAFGPEKGEYMFQQFAIKPFFLGAMSKGYKTAVIETKKRFNLPNNYKFNLDVWNMSIVIDFNQFN